MLNRNHNADIAIFAYLPLTQFKLRYRELEDAAWDRIIVLRDSTENTVLNSLTSAPGNENIIEYILQRISPDVLNNFFLYQSSSFNTTIMQDIIIFAPDYYLVFLKYISIETLERLSILKSFTSDNIFHMLASHSKFALLTTTIEKMDAAGKSFNTGNFKIAFHQCGFHSMKFFEILMQKCIPSMRKNDGLASLNNVLTVIEKIMARTKLTKEFYAAPSWDFENIMVSIMDVTQTGFFLDLWVLGEVVKFCQGLRNEVLMRRLKNMVIYLFSNLSPQQFKVIFTPPFSTDNSFIDKCINNLYDMLNRLDYIPYLDTDPLKIFQTQTSTHTKMKFDADIISHKYEKFLLTPALGLAEDEEGFLDFYNMVVAHQVTLKSELNREYISLLKKSIENLPRAHNSVKEVKMLLGQMENALYAVAGSKIELTESHYALSQIPVNSDKQEEIKNEIREEWNKHMAEFKQYIDERREAIGTSFWSRRTKDFVLRERYYNIVSKENFLENPTSLRIITNAIDDEDLAQGKSKKCLSFLWQLKKDLVKWDALLSEHGAAPVAIRMC